MIRTLLGLLRPTGGDARVFGLDIRRDGVAIRDRTGNLPGDFYFDERVTGEELLDLIEDLRGVGDRAYARLLAERFNADLDRPLGELSRGNRQKVGIIQAVAHRPELVIMDEPTSGLDPLMQEEFDDLVGELRDGGATVFLSSHNLTEVERLCERVAIIREGRLVTVETVDDILSRVFRHVTLQFAGPVDPAEFAALPGVSDLSADGNRLSFKLSGDFQPMLNAAAHHRVLDMEVARPSLEEAFLTYYGGQ
jgi:ABC-2 type transport system ATP-binding protein